MYKTLQIHWTPKRSKSRKQEVVAVRLTVVLDHMFYKLPDGSVWSEMSMPYSFWARYLSVFEQVRIAGRVKMAHESDPNWVRVDGERVCVEGVSDYRGPLQYLVKAVPIHLELSRMLSENEAYVLRLPSNLGSIAARILWARGMVFGAEVVGDPYEVFAPGAVRHPLRPLFRYWFTRQLKKWCAAADAVAYVTAESLQRRYPPGPNAYTTHYSDVELSADSFAHEPKKYFRATEPTLIAVGSLAQLYKGPDVLLRATQLLLKQGLDIRVVWVGGGRHLEDMQALADDLGVGDRVRFTGVLPSGRAVRNELDRADLFVLPSRTEGLPRAFIEAMARGLPCIGTRVGGIPELLDESCLVPPNDPLALALKVREFISNPIRMAEMSARNLRVATEYHEERLRQRRNVFYATVKELTGKSVGSRRS